ncbi:MAG: tetratricopeptide repeat protein [Methanotrichaceae archaeon]
MKWDTIIAKPSLNLIALCILCISVTAQENTTNYWLNEGQSLMANGSFEQAYQAYDKAIQIDPESANAWCGKGFALFELRKYEEAIKAYGKALEIDPKNVDAWSGRGTTLGQIGRYAESLEAYDKAIENIGNLPVTTNQSKKLSSFWVLKGFVFDLTKRTDEALIAFTKAAEIDPQNVDAWVAKYKILTELGKHDEADEALAKARDLGYPK